MKTQRISLVSACFLLFTFTIGATLVEAQYDARDMTYQSYKGYTKEVIKRAEINKDVLSIWTTDEKQYDYICSNSTCLQNITIVVDPSLGGTHIVANDYGAYVLRNSLLSHSGPRNAKRVTIFVRTKLVKQKWEKIVRDLYATLYGPKDIIPVVKK